MPLHNYAFQRTVQFEYIKKPEKYKIYVEGNLLNILVKPKTSIQVDALKLTQACS